MEISFFSGFASKDFKWNSFLVKFVVSTVIIFSLSADASPGDDASFFKLHQATGFFEQFIAGSCPPGKINAQRFLNSLDKFPSDSVLNRKEKELRALVKNKTAPTVTEVESFRLSIHEIMEKQSLHHEQHWHDEILAECKAHKF